MSKLRKAAQQALEAFASEDGVQMDAAYDALRAALAQPERKVNQELLDALNCIDEICAAPPNFSDATIQEIVRAAIAKFEQEQTMAKLQREAQERGEYEARANVLAQPDLEGTAHIEVGELRPVNVVRQPRPEQEPVLHKWAALFEDPNNDWQAGYESARRWVLEVGLQPIAAPPQRKPLTEEEIYKLFGYDNQHGVVPGYAMSFVRALEKAHGIGP